jgi:general secretion pathway protein D
MAPRSRLLQLCLVVAAAAGLAGCEPWLPSWPRPPEPGPPAAVSATVPPAQPAAPVALPETPAHAVPVVERGTGVFVRTPPARSRASIARNAAGEVTLNVVDADLREVVRLVLEDTLHVNYVIDPAVGGTITVQTSQPVPSADLPAMLDAVLRVNGAALVQLGNLYKVVPIDQALSSGPAPGIHPAPDAGRSGFGVVVVPVRFVSAAELVPLLEPFAPPGGSLQVDPERNLLLLAGTQDELNTLTDLVAMFDVDWLAGMSFGLYPLDFARPAELVPELEQIFATEAGPVSGVVRFLPIERLNAVLVMSTQPAYLGRAEAWIQRLDQAGEGGEPQVFVYPVQNGRAADLADVLGEIFNVQSTAVGPRDLLAPGLAPASIGSSLIGQGLGANETGTESAMSAEPRLATAPNPRPTALQGQGNQPGARPSLQSSRLASLQSGRPPTSQLGAAGAAVPEMRIIGDATTNSLVIWATPRDYRKIRKALEQLDILPLQVLIEATVAEVSLKNELRYGVEWFLRSGDFSTTLTTAANGLVSGAFQGFSALLTGSDGTVVLKALESVTDVDVVSSPHLLVLDNQTARIQVGDQVPITVQQATSVANPDAPIVNSIEMRDTGVILSVTPRVNASGLVIMELQQEVSNVARSEAQTTSSEQSSPTISQRQISSTVAVQSGETIVLGGLIQDNRDRSVSGLPLLARLPIIGALFGTRSRSNDRTELLVLLTPRVIRGVAEARAVTNEVRRRLQSVAPLADKMH